MGCPARRRLGLERFDGGYGSVTGNCWVGHLLLSPPMPTAAGEVAKRRQVVICRDLLTATRDDDLGADSRHWPAPLKRHRPHRTLGRAAPLRPLPQPTTSETNIVQRHDRLVDCSTSISRSRDACGVSGPTRTGNRDVHILGRRRLARRYQLSTLLRHSPLYARPSVGRVSSPGGAASGHGKRRAQSLSFACLASQPASMLTARLGLDTSPTTATEVPPIQE